MRLSKLSLGLAASALAAAPIAAQSTSALDRASAPVEGESELFEGIGAGAIIAIIAGAGMAVLLLTDDDDDDEPISAG